jgi:hypothetical protein
VLFPLLLVLALLLPFETKDPLFRLGPLGITSVELPLYALVAGSLLRRETWRPWSWTSVHWAAVAWAAAYLAAATVALGDRAQAIRFALRICAGAALVFPVVAATRQPGRVLAVLRALVAGAVLSAAMAVAEAFVPGAAALLALFKTTTAHVGDVIRAGGPFQYPNPAALYWSAALPVLIAIEGMRGRSEAPARAWPTIAGGVVLVTAIAASGSRGALLATVVVLGTLAVVAPLRLRRAAKGTIALMGAAALLVGLLRPTLLLRESRSWGEAPWFAARFEPLGLVPAMSAGQATTLKVEARNVGLLTWEATGRLPMAVSARWLDAEGRLAHEEAATLLPTAVARGATAVLGLEVTAPGRPGRYRLLFELVGGGTSFEAPAAGSGETLVEVAGGTVAPERDWTAPRPRQRQVTRPELWRAGWRMWRDRPLFGVGPDGFRQRYGSYLGPWSLDTRVNANSLYVETLADLGLLGTAALAFVFVSLARQGSRSWRQTSGSERGLILASAGALLAFALHGLVDSVLAFTPLHGLFWIHAGLLARRTGIAPTP